MRRTSLVIATLVPALALSATAGAEINSFAEARRGSLHVLSSVLVSGHSVDMRGGWFNTLSHAQPRGGCASMPRSNGRPGTTAQL
jgi:hypothetical protein